MGEAESLIFPQVEGLLCVDLGETNTFFITAFSACGILPLPSAQYLRHKETNMKTNHGFEHSQVWENDLGPIHICI